MASLIGALRVSLSADTANFESGMRRAQAVTNSTASGITKTLGLLKGSVVGFVSALSVGMFVNVIKGALEYAGSLAEVANQVGATAKELQVLRFAAGQVGVSQEQLEVGLKKLTITMGQLAAGAEKPRKALDAVKQGLADQIQHAGTSGNALRILAGAFEHVSSRAQRAAVETAVMSKAGSALDNLLVGGTAALDDLAAAAEKLGIVLSDEQIKNADDTADKLEAVKTVLQADIAGVVAANSEAILGLANAFLHLVSATIQAGQALANFMSYSRQIASQEAQSHPQIASAVIKGAGALNPVLGLAVGRFLGGPTSSPKAPPKLPPPPPVPDSPDIGKFLAKGGGGHKENKGKEDHTAEQQLREAFQFNQDLNRAQTDVLRAQEDLARDYIARTAISIQIKDKEKEAYQAELDYNVQLYALTKGKQGMSQDQANQLRTQKDIQDSLERQKILQDEEEQRLKDVQSISNADFDRRKDALSDQEELATTAAERRKIELELLDIAYQQRKQALEFTIQNSHDIAEQENARRDLIALKAGYGAQRQGVMNRTRGPFEEWAASIPQSAAQINEALQTIEVDGFEGLVDAMTEVISGTKKLKDAFGDLAKSIISDILKMTLRMLVFRAVSAIFGSQGPSPAINVTNATLPGMTPPGLADGGSFRIRGFAGTDRNMLSLNGLPVARVSHGERVSVNQDGANDGGATIINQHFAPNFAGNAATKEDLFKMAQLTKEQTLVALRDKNRRQP